MVMRPIFHQLMSWADHPPRRVGDRVERDWPRGRAPARLLARKSSTADRPSAAVVPHGMQAAPRCPCRCSSQASPLGLGHQPSGLIQTVMGRRLQQQASTAVVPVLTSSQSCEATTSSAAWAPDGLRAHREAVAHKVIHAARATAGGGGQRPACAGLQAASRWPRRFRAGMPRTRVAGSGASARAAHRPPRSRWSGGPGIAVCRRGMRSFHSMVKCGSTICSGGQVQPDLEEFERVGLGGVEQRKHFRVLNALARRDPLHIAPPKRAAAPSESAWSMSPCAPASPFQSPGAGGRGKAGHGLAVVHAPAVFCG